MPRPGNSSQLSCFRVWRLANHIGPYKKPLRKNKVTLYLIFYRGMADVSLTWVKK